MTVSIAAVCFTQLLKVSLELSLIFIIFSVSLFHVLDFFGHLSAVDLFPSSFASKQVIKVSGPQDAIKVVGSSASQQMVETVVLSSPASQ